MVCEVHLFSQVIPGHPVADWRLVAEYEDEEEQRGVLVVARLKGWFSECDRRQFTQDLRLLECLLLEG